MASLRKASVVTGGAGFIGSHLCEALLKKGYEVFCFDNLFTGREENISHLLKNPYFHFHKFDVINSLPEKFLPQKLAVIFHLASPAGPNPQAPKSYLKFPIETYLVNSIGAHNLCQLALEKKAIFLFASTSEIYGDPKEHPQKETYRGNVNTVGERSCYDESKRFGEMVTSVFARKFSLDTRIIRIFNSVLGDQQVIFFNNENFHSETIERSFERLKQNNNKNVVLPAFDPNNQKITLKKVTAIVRHPYNRDAYEVTTRYGRKVKVTGDHSVFKRSQNGNPIAVPVRQLEVGDYIAIPSKLPVIEKDIKVINIAKKLTESRKNSELWRYAVYSKKLKPVIVQNKKTICEMISLFGHYKSKYPNWSAYGKYFKCLKQCYLPLLLVKKLKIKIPVDAKIRMHVGGAHIYTPNKIKVINDILWLLGFFLAEGSFHYKDKKDAFLTFSSDEALIRRAKKILEDKFGVHVILAPYSPQRAPSIFVHSKVLYFIFNKIFKILPEKAIPAWILQLPLKRLRFFLEGYREGDGTHSGKKMGRELCFDTTSKKLSEGILNVLLRFGIIGCYGKYHTTFRKKYDNILFPFYRVTVCELSNFNILTWHKGVKQKLNAKRTGDLVWALVRRIEKCELTNYVYDFSVPGAENFIAGNGIFCHNTYGPRMNPLDGRALPVFIRQALQNTSLTIFGDGKQTRSFCYIDDLIGGIIKVFTKGKPCAVYNLGNPKEITILKAAELVKKLTGSDSSFSFKKLPKDDPKRRCPDISKAKKELGWQPKISLKKGLKKTINYFRKFSY